MQTTPSRVWNMPNISIELLVEELREQLGWYCAFWSTSMTFGTYVDQNILNSII